MESIARTVNDNRGILWLELHEASAAQLRRRLPPRHTSTAKHQFYHHMTLLYGVPATDPRVRRHNGEHGALEVYAHAHNSVVQAVRVRPYAGYILPDMVMNPDSLHITLSTQGDIPPVVAGGMLRSEPGLRVEKAIEPFVLQGTVKFISFASRSL